MIDHIRGAISNASGHEGFGFYYCNWNDTYIQGTLPILCAFVRQLSTIAGRGFSIQKDLLRLYDKKQKNGWTLSEQDCKDLLRQFVNIYPKITLVLDGLDECDLRTRHQLIEVFAYLLEHASRPVKIFISSRSDSELIAKLNEGSSIHIQAKDNHDDIARFVQGEIARHKKLESMDDDLQEDIINSFSRRGDGM